MLLLKILHFKSKTQAIFSGTQNLTVTFSISGLYPFPNSIIARISMDFASPMPEISLSSLIEALRKLSKVSKC